MSRAARLGAFIVVTLAILVAGIFIIGGKQYLFSSTYQLKAQFDNVVGLDAGGDVRVGGVHSGTVHSIVLPHKPGEKVTVVMDLANRRTRSSSKTLWPRSKPRVCWATSIWRSRLDPLGQPTCGMAIPSPASRHWKCRTCWQKTSDILDSSQQAIQNATRATANLDSISAKIDGGQGTAGALVNDKQLYTNLEQTSEHDA